MDAGEDDVPCVANIEDAHALLTLKRAVVRDTYSAYDAERLAAWMDRFCDDRYMTDRFANNDTFFFLGDRNTPSAMAALKVRDGHAYIGDIYCSCAGRGQGSRLLGHALDRACGQGLETAVADVFADNDRAIGFLRAHGFVPAGGYAEQSLGVWVHRLTRPIVRSDIQGHAGVASLRALRAMQLSEEDRTAIVRERMRVARAWRIAGVRARLHELHADHNPQLLDRIAENAWGQMRHIAFTDDGRTAVLYGDHPGGEAEEYSVTVSIDPPANHEPSRP